MNPAGTLWARDICKLRREPSRWFGILAQPLVFWAVAGLGLGGHFQFEAVPGRPQGYLAYFFPGTLVMCILFTTIFHAMGVIEDRSTGFLRGVLAQAPPKLAVVWGKVAGCTTMTCVQIALLLFLAPLAGYPFASLDLWSLAGAVVLGSMALGGLNFAVAWLLGSTQGYHGVMMLLLFPLWMASGSLFPITDPWVQTLSLANPMAALTAGVRGGLLGLPNWGALGALALWTALGLGAACVSLRKPQSLE